MATPRINVPEVSTLRAVYPLNRRHSLATDRRITLGMTKVGASRAPVTDDRLESSQMIGSAVAPSTRDILDVAGSTDQVEWYDEIEMPSPVRCEFKRFRKSRSYRGFLKRSLTIGRIRGVRFEESNFVDDKFEKSGFRYPGGFGRNSVSPPPTLLLSPASGGKRLEPFPFDVTYSSAASTVSAMSLASSTGIEEKVFREENSTHDIIPYSTRELAPIHDSIHTGGISDQMVAAAITLAEQIEMSNSDVRESTKPSPLRQSSIPPNNRSLFNEYTLGAKLGTGSFSTVCAARRKDDPSVEVAVKLIPKAHLREDSMQQIVAEVQLLREINHPHVVRFVDFFDETNYFSVVTDLVKGGDLFMRIIDKARYLEAEARDVVKTLLEVLKYLHEHGVVHRDIKPENILLTSDEDDTSIKLCDFSLSGRFDKHRSLSTGCGSPHYIAPEILRKDSYGPKCDVWSLGVVTFTLLCGYLPFDTDDESNDAEIFKAILTANFEFDAPFWDDVSDHAKDFVRRTLVVDQLERPSASELLSHEWIISNNNQVDLTSDLTSSIGRLRKTEERRRGNRMRAAGNAITVVNWLRKKHEKLQTQRASSSDALDEKVKAK